MNLCLQSVSATAVVPTVAEAVGAAAAIPTATETMGGVTKAVEVGVEAVKVESGALHAATKLDLAVKEGAGAPVKALEDLVASPVLDAKNAAGQVVEVKEVVSPEASTIDAEWAKERYTEISRTVQPSMKKWDTENIPKSEDEIPDWIERRTAAEKKLVIDKAVNQDVEDWKSHHSEPDANDTTAHSKWEKQLAEEQSRSHQANESSYEQFLAQRQEENHGMSKQEFMRLYAILLQKRAAADNFAMYLAKQPREQYARLMPVLQDMRNKIGLLEAQLSFDAAGSTWKQWIIPAMVGVSMAAAPMGTAMSES